MNIIRTTKTLGAALSIGALLAPLAASAGDIGKAEQAWGIAAQYATSPIPGTHPGFLPPPPPPPSGTGAYVCWYGTANCQEVTEQEAAAALANLWNAAVSELGTAFGGDWTAEDLVQRDAAGRIIAVSCLNGAQLVVSYASTPYVEASYESGYESAYQSSYESAYESSYNPSPSCDVSISAEPTLVESKAPGGSSRLLWNASCASSCTITDSSGATIFSGAPGAATTTTSVSGITKQTRYTLSCDSGQSTDFVLVNVVPFIKEF